MTLPNYSVHYRTRASMVSIALGKRKVPTTAMPLAQCAVNFPTQITQNTQIVKCLQNFPQP